MEQIVFSPWLYFTGFVQSGFATRTKCWYMTFLQTRDSLTFCICHTLPTTCHMTFTLHVYDLEFISECGGYGGFKGGLGTISSCV